MLFCEKGKMPEQTNFQKRIVVSAHFLESLGSTTFQKYVEFYGKRCRKSQENIDCVVKHLLKDVIVRKKKIVHEKGQTIIK